MKKMMILSVALFMAGTVSVIAQSSTSTKTNGLHLGLRAGANLSNIVTGDNTDFNNGSKIGLTAAAFLEIPIVNGFSVQPELQYAQKGYKADGRFLGSNYEYKLTSHFIEVPILAKFKPAKAFGIVVGPQFSFLTSTSTKLTTPNATFENQINQDNDNLRKNILGGVIGVEATLGGVVLDLRYARDFQNNNGDGTTSTPRYKNQVIALTAGFRF